MYHLLKLSKSVLTLSSKDNGQLPPAQISKEIFIELMNVAAKSVEFSFNNVKYKQTDGVAMGSPPGPALADIFVGYYKKKAFYRR